VPELRDEWASVPDEKEVAAIEGDIRNDLVLLEMQYQIQNGEEGGA
jgi:hypothetical protein